MKKKMNFLCAMVFVVLIVSMSETIYSIYVSASIGAQAGYEMGKEIKETGKTPHNMIDDLIPLHVVPNSLLSTPDSIFNEKTQSYVPIWYTQAAIGIQTKDSSITQQLIKGLIGLLMLISGGYVIVQFIKLIKTINHYEIFCWRNVRRLRKIGFGLLVMFTMQVSMNLMINLKLSEILVLSNYSIDWISFFSDSSLLLGVVSLVFAEIFAVGLNMKEEQDLTI